MHPCSDTPEPVSRALLASACIAHLAGALAKAQLDLVNPTKSMVAYLEEAGRGVGGQSYRYAPLSAGLDIIRTTLGRHDLAVIQATDVDEARGSVVLTTTLVHASGQWIASRWPVCPISTIGHPKLMGAALTYARRYSLFALVGITGEDDLDAPEFARPGAEQQREAGAGARPMQQSRTAVRVRGRVTGMTKAHAPPEVRTRAASQARAPSPPPSPPSGSDWRTSLEAVQDEEALLTWARETMPLRSHMDEAERTALDAAFVSKAEALGTAADELNGYGGSRDDLASEVHAHALAKGDAHAQSSL